MPLSSASGRSGLRLYGLGESQEEEYLKNDASAGEFRAKVG